MSAYSDLQNREQLEDLDLNNMNGTMNGNPSLANGTSSGYFNELTSTLTGTIIRFWVSLLNPLHF